MVQRTDAMAPWNPNTRRTADNFNSIAYSTGFASSCDMRSPLENCHHFLCLSFGVHSTGRSRFASLIEYRTRFQIECEKLVDVSCPQVFDSNHTLDFDEVHMPRLLSVNVGLPRDVT